MDIMSLFGGTRPWDTALWETTDDRVRGGASQSYLYVVNPEHARFYGHLDISTLGGAGFASQNSVGQLSLDLSDYDGILITVLESDGKKYIVTLKDEIPGRREDGRRESGVSWEASFSVPPSNKDGTTQVFIPWKDFEATYRGRSKPDAKPLKLSDIKRVSLMMRSFFGQQEGDFSLDLHSIAAWRKVPESQGHIAQPCNLEQGNRMSDSEEDVDDDLHKPHILEARPRSSTQRRPWWKLLCCGLI